jgi:multidrug transporter EmrE-like cation transporter
MSWLLVAIVLTRTISDILMKKSVHCLHFDTLSSLWPNVKGMLKTPIFGIGLILGAINVLLWPVALRYFELSYAYPFLSISFVLIILSGKWMFQEKLDIYKWVGILFIVAGSMSLFFK